MIIIFNIYLLNAIYNNYNYNYIYEYVFLNYNYKH